MNKSNLIQAPCKDCPRKGCGEYHNECEAYQAYVNANTKQNATIRNAKHQDRIASGVWFAKNKKGGAQR